MDYLLKHYSDWLLLFALLAAAIYTLNIIRQESSGFLEECYEVSFGRLKLPIPQWWSIARQEERLIEFVRTDTRYDWYARFEFIPADPTTPLHEFLSQKVHSDELDYDAQDVVIDTNPRHIFRHRATQEYFPEVIRVEGKASQRIEERVYLDLFLFRHSSEGGYYLCESRSSVLNGMIEGPFFEECLSLLKIDES